MSALAASRPPVEAGHVPPALVPPFTSGGDGVRPTALTSSRVAELLRIGIATVGKQARLGRLAGEFVDGRWRFTPGAVADYARRHRIGVHIRCRECGRDFPRASGLSAYCDPQCARRASYRRNAGPVVIGVERRRCERAGCGRAYTVRGAGQRFCGPGCRQLAFFDRHGFTNTLYSYGAQRVGPCRYARRLDGKETDDV